MSITFLSPNHLRDRGSLELYSDGEYSAIVEFQVTDSNGAPIADGTVANIDDQNDGRNLAATDDDTSGSGRIVYTSDGVGKFKLLPSTTSKSFTLTISISGQTDLTAKIYYNDPTVDVYFISSNDSEDPEWIDGVATGYAKVVISSDYFDVDGNEFDVSNRPIVMTYTDESSVSHTLNLTTNASGVVQTDLGPLTNSFTYEVLTTVSFSFTAGTRTIAVSEQETINVVFSRTPVVSMTIVPTDDYTLPLELWGDGRSESGSQKTLRVIITYDYNDTYFSSAQFDADNPGGVAVAFSAYDDDGSLAIVNPTSGTFASATYYIDVVVGPSTKTTNATFKALISASFNITFGTETILHTGDVAKQLSVNFIEPTFTMDIEFNVGETPSSPTTLDNDLFPTGSKKTGTGYVDLGSVRAFADNDFEFAAKIVISSDYDDVSPDKTALTNKSIKFESERCEFDTFNSLVENFDPNNDSHSFLNFLSSTDILDGSGNPQHTVYNSTTYSASDNEISTYVTINKQVSVGDKNIYMQITATTSFNYTFGSRTLNVDDVSSSGILTDFPAAPRVSLNIQYHSDDPDDTENKLPADQSKYLFSLVRDGAVDADGKAVTPTEQPEPRRRPGKFTVTATDYLGNQLQGTTDIIVRTNDAFTPLILHNMSSYTDRVCRFMFDNPLNIRDNIYVIVEVVHNGLYRSTKSKIPYFTNTDKEFYTKDIFMRDITSVTNGFTTSKSTIDSAILSLGYPFGQTPLYEAVFNGAIEFMDDLRDEIFDNKFMVLLTDGIDNFSKETEQTSIDNVNSVEGKNEVRLYPIALGNISNISDAILDDYATDTGSYTDILLKLDATTQIEDIVNTILNHNFKNISSTIRTFSRDFKEIVRVSQLLVDMIIPSGYELYLQARANQNSASSNSADWSSWTTETQILSSGTTTITFDPVLTGRYFEFKVKAINSNIEV